MFTLLEIGGKIRDELLGIRPIDIDYVVIPSEEIRYRNAEEILDLLRQNLLKEGFTINNILPQYYTIRVRFPKNHNYSNKHADFVLSRREIGYIPGTRTPVLEIGTLRDDMERRDFTVNTLARGDDGVILNYFNGLEDLQNRILRTTIDARQSMLNDPLRLLRAFRFHITKDFVISQDIMETCKDDEVVDNLKIVLSKDRIRNELELMFRHDTLKTWRLMRKIEDLNPKLFEILFEGIWLRPTLI